MSESLSLIHISEPTRPLYISYAVLKFFRYGALGGEAPPNEQEETREGVSGVHK